MFRSLCTALCLMACITFAALPSQAAEKTLRISSTIGPVDAGIIPLLAETFTKKTGIPVTYAKAGTGATLKKAESGNFDLVIVHARSLEDAFVEAGFGVDRRDVMYNDFVILGPKNDPAGIRGTQKVSDALTKIAQKKAPFVTRNDNSGTHVKEMQLWKAANITPDGDWYIRYADGAKGNKATTLYTNEQQAYVLMDRATWLTLKNDLNLEILVENDPSMLNLIALIRVSPERFKDIHKDEALSFADWVVGDEAQIMIRDFGKDKYGDPLFFPNSDQWNAKNPKK